MNQKTVSVLAVIVNIFLTLGKIILGLLFNLTALIAEGIHSGLDIISSIVAFWGIKSSKKPVDKNHPYGYYRSESLAGFVVIIILVISAIWIIYEGIIGFIYPNVSIISIWAIILMGISAIINEIMARLKFYVGVKYSSPALIADGEHSRADVISSIGVLIGIVLIKFWTGADDLVAILIGLYILWESWQLGRQITDSLLDVSDLEIEEKIRKIAKESNILISQIKSRKLGSATMVDLQISLNPALQISEVTIITNKLQNLLLNKIINLKSINISVTSHEYEQSELRTVIGSNIKYKRGIEAINLPKLGYRIIVSLTDVDNPELGTSNFLIIDQDKEGNVLRKIKIKNKFYEDNIGHGVKFAKAISADEVWSTHIGQNAQKNLNAANIKFKIIKAEKLKDMIDSGKNN